MRLSINTWWNRESTIPVFSQSRSTYSKLQGNQFFQKLTITATPSQFLKKWALMKGTTCGILSGSLLKLLKVSSLVFGMIDCVGQDAPADVLSPLTAVERMTNASNTHFETVNTPTQNVTIRAELWVTGGHVIVGIFAGACVAMTVELVRRCFYSFCQAKESTAQCSQKRVTGCVDNNSFKGLSGNSLPRDTGVPSRDIQETTQPMKPIETTNGPVILKTILTRKQSEAIAKELVEIRLRVKQWMQILSSSSSQQVGRDLQAIEEKYKEVESLEENSCLISMKEIIVGYQNVQKMIVEEVDLRIAELLKKARVAMDIFEAFYMMPHHTNALKIFRFNYQEFIKFQTRRKGSISDEWAPYMLQTLTDVLLFWDTLLKALREEADSQLLQVSNYFADVRDGGGEILRESDREYFNHFKQLEYEFGVVKESGKTPNNEWFEKLRVLLRNLEKIKLSSHMAKLHQDISTVQDSLLNNLDYSVETRIKGFNALAMLHPKIDRVSAWLKAVDATIDDARQIKSDNECLRNDQLKKLFEKLRTQYIFFGSQDFTDRTFLEHLTQCARSTDPINIFLIGDQLTKSCEATLNTIPEGYKVSVHAMVST